MLNFELYNPTNLVFGKGQMEKLGVLYLLDQNIIGIRWWKYQKRNTSK
jgi:NADP-dependent alcohol dehydrogenase